MKTASVCPQPSTLIETQPLDTECGTSDHSEPCFDKCQQVRAWQRSHYLSDSGFHTGLGTNTPSINSKFGLDDYDDDKDLTQKSMAHWPSFPLSVNPTDPSLMSPETPGAGSSLGVDTLGETLGGSHSASNVDLRGNRLPEIDTDEAANAIPELVKLIKDEDDQVIIYQSSMMVFQLSKSEAIDALIKSMDMIECITSALGRTSDPETVRFLSGTLYNMSQTQMGLKAIFAANCVPCLVNLLDSPVESVLFYAITTLHNLLLHQDGAKSVIRQSGCLQKMTSLLRKNNVKFLTICTDCLQILAYGHQESKLLILSSGGPMELVRILRCYQYEKLLWTTARVLKVLSVCTSNKPAIIAAGGMDALAKHLHNSSHRLVINSLWALRNLSDAATKLDNLHPLLHSLVQLLDCGDTNMVTCAAGILSNLTCNNHANKFFVYKFGGMQGLLKAIGQVGAREDILEPCMCALRHLTSRHEEEETARHMIVHELAGLPLLARILHASTAGICPDLGLVCQPPQNPVTSWMLIKAMVGLLRNLSVNIDSHFGMRKYGLVTGLFLLLYATQHEIARSTAPGTAPSHSFVTMIQNVRLEEIVEGICGALHMLAKDHTTRSYLASLRAPDLFVASRVQQGSSGLAIFVHLLYSPHESIQRAAAGVLAEISQDRDGLDSLATLPGASARFDELVFSRNEAIATYASAIIIRLNEDRRNLLSGSCSVPPLVDVLNTPPLPSDTMRSYTTPLGQHSQLASVHSAPSTMPIASTAPSWSTQLPQEHSNPSSSPPFHSLTEMLGPPPAVYKAHGCPNYPGYWEDSSSADPCVPLRCPDRYGSSFSYSPAYVSYPNVSANARMEPMQSMDYTQLCPPSYISHPSCAQTSLHATPHEVIDMRTSEHLSSRISDYTSLDTSGYMSPSNDLCLQQSPTAYKPQHPSICSHHQPRYSLPPYQLAGPNLSPSLPVHGSSRGCLSPELMSLDEATSDWLTSSNLL